MTGARRAELGGEAELHAPWPVAPGPVPARRDGVTGRAGGGAGLKVDGEVGFGEPAPGGHRGRGGGDELDLPDGQLLPDGAAAVRGIGEDLGDHDGVLVEEPWKGLTVGRSGHAGLRRGDEVGVKVHRQVHLVAVVAVLPRTVSVFNDTATTEMI